MTNEAIRINEDDAPRPRNWAASDAETRELRAVEDPPAQEPFDLDEMAKKIATMFDESLAQAQAEIAALRSELDARIAMITRRLDALDARIVTTDLKADACRSGKVQGCKPWGGPAK